jgi:hypothetical protein
VYARVGSQYRTTSCWLTTWTSKFINCLRCYGDTRWPVSDVIINYSGWCFNFNFQSVINVVPTWSRLQRRWAVALILILNEVNKKFQNAGIDRIKGNCFLNCLHFREQFVSLNRLTISFSPTNLQSTGEKVKWLRDMRRLCLVTGVLDYDSFRNVDLCNIWYTKVQSCHII